MTRTLAFLLSCAALASAEHYDPVIFGALQWRSLGPLRGGRSITSAGSSSRPNEYYFGAVGGGLWKTTDGGATWKPVTDGQIHSSSVGAVVEKDLVACQNWFLSFTPPAGQHWALGSRGTFTTGGLKVAVANGKLERVVSECRGGR